MKTFKRILSLVLVLAMMIPTLYITGIPTSAATSGTCGTDLTWTLDDEGTLTISGTGAMTDYDYSSSVPWYSSRSSIKTVVINNGVTSIGDDAFRYCDALKSITIPDSVTSIGWYAFYSCDALKSITIGNGVTSIGDDAFRYCTSLTSITIPDSVTSIGDYAFSYCTSLTSITVADGNEYYKSVDGVLFDKDMQTLIQYPIGNQRSEYSVPDGVTSIGESAFEGCTSLTSITIPDSVTSIGSHAFYSSDALKSITIPDSVTSIGNLAFYNTGYYNDSTNWVDEVLYIGNHLIKAKTSISGSYSIKEGTTCIADYAFEYCTSLASITIPDSVTSIGNLAFYYCRSLKSITIGNGVTSIGNHAFQYYSNSNYYNLNITIYCYENSYAHTYALDNGFNYKLHSFTDYISDNNATCTADGTKTAYCDNGCGATDTVADEGTATGHIFTVYTHREATCTLDAAMIAVCDNGCGTEDVITEEGSMLPHAWTEWMTVTEPTYTEEGLRIRYCTVCLFGEEEAVAKLLDPNAPVITVDNFTVTITNAEYIKDMRYAPGVYATTTEIRNAEGNVALSNEIVVKNTVDGNFVYRMPASGFYTIWIRMQDGTNYILPLDVTHITPTVSSNGVTVTLHDLYDVKDFYIAKGEYNTYREIKENGYIFSATGAKIGTKKDYTCTVYEPGVHTILIRYNDGTQAIFHETLTVDEPVFTTNGLQVTISNIPGVKVIRTAYGEYNTPGDTKRAEGARNFSSKVIKGAEEYTIQYRENGVVTVVVEYNNGYVQIFHHEIQQKTATIVQTKSVVMFKDLDGFVMIRYAKGEYTTAAEIKRAEGSKVIKPTDINGEYAVVSGLKAGTYTFCVQFDDESYNYFTITI